MIFVSSVVIHKEENVNESRIKKKEKEAQDIKNNQYRFFHPVNRRWSVC